jgi:hypothetical protein
MADSIEAGYKRRVIADYERIDLQLRTQLPLRTDCIHVNDDSCVLTPKPRLKSRRFRDFGGCARNP